MTIERVATPDIQPMNVERDMKARLAETLEDLSEVSKKKETPAQPKFDTVAISARAKEASAGLRPAGSGDAPGAVQSAAQEARGPVERRAGADSGDSSVIQVVEIEA